MAEVIGFVGVGDMGGPMACNLLQAGFEGAAYDIRADAIAQDGATEGSSGIFKCVEAEAGITVGEDD